MPLRSPSAVPATSVSPPPSPFTQRALAAPRKEATQTLNTQFLKEIVANWEAYSQKHYDFSQLLSEYKGYADRLSNGESFLDEPFRFHPLGAESVGASEEFEDQVVEATSTDGWNAEARENNLGPGDVNPSASGTGKASRPDTNATKSIGETKAIDYITVGVEQYKMETPLKGT